MCAEFNGLSKSAVALLAVLVAACASAPPKVEKATSVMLPHPQSSVLGASVAALSHGHPGLSGHVVLDTCGWRITKLYREPTTY